MGNFDDGYLGAVVRGIGSNQNQQQLLMFDPTSSSSSQPSLMGAESSSPAVGSPEAVDSALRESPPDMLDSAVSLDHSRAEETIDLHEILDATIRQLSPPIMAMKASHSPSSSAKAVQVRHQSLAGEPEAALAIVRRVSSQLISDHTSIPDGQPHSEIHDDPIPKQEQLSEPQLVLMPTFSQSAPSSDLVLSSKTWAALPLIQKDEHSGDISDQPGSSSLEKQSSLPTYHHSSNPKQPGSKRRKGQQKRVVCVPTTVGGNSSEVLPSDMWAWRKYGQKPIKGSPYPRGYYRCSSSKGCSARKQVERSRTDPSMLVVTYTSEHNHAWPAHRNSLAGTTRSKSTGKLRTSGTQHTPAPSAAAANSSTTLSHQTTVHLQEHSLVLPSAMEVSAIDDADAVHGHDIPLVFDDAPLAGSHDQHLFQDLEELPELAAFMDDSFFSYRSAHDDTGSMQGVDPLDLFCWSSSSFQGNEIAGI